MTPPGNRPRCCSISPDWSPPRIRRWPRVTLYKRALRELDMDKTRNAKFKIGQVVKHRLYPFRGVIFDIDPVFNNTEEWWQAIPAEIRPRKDQPFYHLFAENEENEYIAYVSEQNLLPDTSGTPIRHPDVADTFEQDESGGYSPRHWRKHWMDGDGPTIRMPVRRPR